MLCLALTWSHLVALHLVEFWSSKPVYYSIYFPFHTTYCCRSFFFQSLTGNIHLLCQCAGPCTRNIGINFSQKNLQLFLTVAQYQFVVYCSITLCCCFSSHISGGNWNETVYIHVLSLVKTVFWSPSCPSLDQYHSEDCLMQYWSII